MAIRPARVVGAGAQAPRRRASCGNDRRGLRDRRTPRGRDRGGRAHGCPALPVQHPGRHPHLGCRASVLPAQDPHRPAGADPHPSPGRRALGIHETLRERVRPLRRRARVDLDFLGARIRRLPRPAGQEEPGRRGHRRRRAHRRHGLRGHEQRGLDGHAPHRGPQRQRDVDRPPGRRDERIPLAADLVQALPFDPRYRTARGGEISAGGRTRGEEGREVCPRPRDRRNALRGARLLLRRADRRPQPGPSSAHPAQREGRCRLGSDPGPRLHEEGEGLCSGGGVRGPVPRGFQLRRRHRNPEKVRLQCAVLHQGVRAEPGDGGAPGRPHLRNHRCDAVGNGGRSLRGSVPGALVRCRARRTARGDLRGRSRGGRDEAGRAPSIPPSCNAVTIRWSTTWRSSPCRCGSPWTGPGWSGADGQPPTPDAFDIGYHGRVCRAWC